MAKMKLFWKIYPSDGVDGWSDTEYDWSSSEYARNIQMNIQVCDDYLLVAITAETEEQARHEMSTQLTDGIFENTKIDHEEEVFRFHGGEFTAFSGKNWVGAITTVAADIDEACRNLNAVEVVRVGEKFSGRGGKMYEVKRMNPDGSYDYGNIRAIRTEG